MGVAYTPPYLLSLEILSEWGPIKLLCPPARTHLNSIQNNLDSCSGDCPDTPLFTLECLCFLSQNHVAILAMGTEFWLPPLKASTLSKLVDIFSLSTETSNLLISLEVFPASRASCLSSCPHLKGNYFLCTPQRDTFDYIYSFSLGSETVKPGLTCRKSLHPNFLAD